MDILLRLALLALLSLTFSIQSAKAQNDSPGNAADQQVGLPGSAAKVEEVVLKSNAVFVGTITQMGFVDLGAVGVVSYGNVKVKVSQVFLGVVDSVTSVTFDVKNRPKVHEREPQVGNAYIFFAKTNAKGSSDQFTVLKLLPATDDTIAKVKAVIAAK